MLNKIKKFVSMAMASCCLLALCSCSESITKEIDGEYELVMMKINGSAYTPTTDDTSKLTIKNGKISYSITDGNLTGEYKISESDIDKSNESELVITINDSNNGISSIKTSKETDEITLIFLVKDSGDFYAFTENGDALTEYYKNNTESTTSSSSSETSDNRSKEEKLTSAFEIAAQDWIDNESYYEGTVYKLKIGSYSDKQATVKGTFYLKDSYGEISHKFRFRGNYNTYKYDTSKKIEASMYKVEKEY